MTSRSLSWRMLGDPAEIVKVSDKIRALPDDAIVAWDTETTGLSPYAGDYITGISLCVLTRNEEWGEWDSGEYTATLDGVYVPIGHKRGNADPGAVKELMLALQDTHAAHLLHHATFDWAVVKNLGYDVRSKRTVDTQVVRWLQDENQPKALKVLGEILLDEDASLEQRELHAKMKSPWENQTHAYKAVREAYPEIPVKEARAMARRMRADRSWGDLMPTEIAEYAARDATMTAQVADELLGLDQVLSPGKVIEREMEVNHIIFDMTDRGVSADHHQLEAAKETYVGQAEAIAHDIDEAFGATWRAYKGTQDRINLGSKDQVAWLLFEHLGLPVMSRTPGGDPSTSKEALEQLQGDKIAAAVMDYRHWVKAAGSYCAPFMEYLENSADGRIHGMYDSTRTVTGRLSASNPNVMTIPTPHSLPEIRKAFYKTPPGIERLGFDLASAELWVTASFTNDPVLTAALMENRSLHIETMKAVFGTDDKASRYYTLSKNVNYGALYEAGPTALAVFAAKAGFSPKEAERIGYKAWRGHRDLFSRQHYVADFFAQKARERGKLPLHVEGRYRHFKSPGVMVQFYTALNALVQGGIAEYMKDIMIEVYRRGYGELLVLQVHDELVFDAPIGMQRELQQLLDDIADDINPFKHRLSWEGKAWSLEAA